MRLGWRPFWFLTGLAWGTQALAAPMPGAPLLEYSQDGTTFHAFDTMTGRQKVKNYYDYFGLSGHPGFGTVREVATAAVYWDFKRGALSLIDINGSARHGFRNAEGDVTYEFSGLTSSTYLNLADDSKDISYHNGSSVASAHFQYKSSTDGLVLSGLEKKKFKMRIALTADEGINQWRLANGNPGGGGSFVNLDMSQPLYLRMASLPGTPVVPPETGGSGNGGVGGGLPPVPEPGIGLAAVGTLLGLLGARRRR